MRQWFSSDLQEQLSENDGKGARRHEFLWLFSVWQMDVFMWVCTHVHLSVFVYRLEVNVRISFNHSPPYWIGWKFSFFASPKLGLQAWVTAWFLLVGYWGFELKASCLLCRYFTSWAIFPDFNYFIFWGHQMTPLFKGLALQNQSLQLISGYHRWRKQLTPKQLPSDLNPCTHSSHIYTK